MNNETPAALLQQKNKQNILNKIRDNKAKCLSRNDSLSSKRQDSFSLKRTHRTDEHTPSTSQFAAGGSGLKDEGDNSEVDQSELGTSLARINISYEPTPKASFGPLPIEEIESRNVLQRNGSLSLNYPKNMDFTSTYRHHQMAFNPAEAYYKHWGCETGGADTPLSHAGPAMQFGGTPSTPSTANDQLRFSEVNGQFAFRPQPSGRQISSLVLPGPQYQRPRQKSSSFFAQNYKLIESQRASESINSQASPEKMRKSLFQSFKARISKILGIGRASDVEVSSSHTHFMPDQPELKKEDKPLRVRRIKSVVTKLDERDPEDSSSLEHRDENYFQINIMGDKPSRTVQEDAEGDLPIKVGTKKEGWVIKADKPWKLVWNAWIGLLAVALAIWLPISLAFDIGKGSYFLDWLGHSFFFADLLMSSRTSMFHPDTGDLIKEPATIRKLYFLSWGFWVDLMVALPWWTAFEIGGIDLRLIAALKLIRLQPMLIFNLHSENMKLSLKILNLLGYLLLYIHVTACYFYFVADFDQQWLPWQTRFADSPGTFYQQGFKTKYFTSLYTAILILMGNDTNPESDWHVVVVCVFSITGALFIANIFGTITVVVSTLNRKAQKFQDKIDMANTSMVNMKLPASIQQDIREFMMSTHNNLDTQKELDSFMQMISPSLRNKVTKHIFINAIAANPVLQDSQEAVDFLINDVSTLLYLPEDRIINQGEQGDSLFLIAKGSCSVWVIDHMRQQKFVRQLNQGEHFGEVSILYETPRTATVKSSNYCTLASLSRKTFFELCNNFPSIIVRMRERTLDYKDPWKQFKRKVLGEVEYFKDASAKNPTLLDEIQYHLEEEYIEKGSEIVGPECQLKQIIFIVQGVVDLIVFDQNGNERVLESLGQGDTIGQFSSLFDETPIFSAFAKSRVRVLTLDQEFFSQYKDSITGLEDSITACEDMVESTGIPLCDYTRHYKPIRPRFKFFSAIRKARILEQALMISQQFALQQTKEKKSAVRRKEESTRELSIYSRKKRGSILSNGQGRLPKKIQLSSTRRVSSVNRASPNSSETRTRHNGSFKLKSPIGHMRNTLKGPLIVPKRIFSKEQESHGRVERSSSSSTLKSRSSSSSSSSSINKEESFGNIQSPETHKSLTSCYSNTGGSHPRRKNSSKIRKRKQKKANRVQFEILPLQGTSMQASGFAVERPPPVVPPKQPAVPIKPQLPHALSATLPPKQSQFRKASDKRVTIEVQNDLEMYVLSEHSFEESSCSVSASRNQDPVPNANPLILHHHHTGFMASPDPFSSVAGRRRQNTGQISGMFGSEAPHINPGLPGLPQPGRGSSKRIDFSVAAGGLTSENTLQKPSRTLTCSSSMSSTAKEISMARKMSKRMRNRRAPP